MVKNIFFNIEGAINHPFPNEEHVYKNWLSNVAISEHKHIVALHYIFCSDDYLLEINNKFLRHDYYTDVITFPYQQGSMLESDIFISVDRVKENANEFLVTFDNELKRVMVHGLLHLAGYTDKSESETSLMRQKEDFYIGFWNSK